MSESSVFLDTNTLLHYRRLDQVDWPRILEVDSVRLVLVGPVIDEVDRLKDEHQLKHIRARARAQTRYLRDATVAGPIAALSPRVTLVLDVDPSPTDERQLDADDQVLSRIVRYRDANPGIPVVLITADTGLTVRARQRSVVVVALPDELLLPDERDPQIQEIEKLRKDNARLASRLPDVRLEFPDGKDRFVIELPPDAQVNAVVIAERMEAVRKRYPKILPDEPPGIENPLVVAMREASAQLFGVLPKDRATYNEALDGFYRAYEEYLPSLIAHENTLQRAAHLHIDMMNTGGVPAQDVDTLLHFPDGFDLYDAHDLPGPPDPPAPPMRPETPLGQLTNIQPPIGLGPHGRLPDFIPRNVSDATIRKTNSYDVEVLVRRLKHGFRESLPPLVAVFPTPRAVKPFAIEYELRPSNHPQPTVGKLNVICSYSRA